MTTKSSKFVLASLLAFIALVIVFSMAFSDRIAAQKTSAPQIGGGYLFNFNIECVDTDGNVLCTETLTGNGTAWSFATPVIEGYTADRVSIAKDDVTNWNFPASNYQREATGSCTVVYTLNK